MFDFMKQDTTKYLTDKDIEKLEDQMKNILNLANEKQVWIDMSKTDKS